MPDSEGLSGLFDSEDLIIPIFVAFEDYDGLSGKIDLAIFEHDVPVDKGFSWGTR